MKTLSTIFFLLLINSALNSSITNTSEGTLAVSHLLNINWKTVNKFTHCRKASIKMDNMLQDPKQDFLMKQVKSVLKNIFLCGRRVGKRSIAQKYLNVLFKIYKMPEVKILKLKSVIRALWRKAVRRIERLSSGNYLMKVTRSSYKRFKSLRKEKSVQNKFKETVGETKTKIRQLSESAQKLEKSSKDVDCRIAWKKSKKYRGRMNKISFQDKLTDNHKKELKRLKRRARAILGNHCKGYKDVAKHAEAEILRSFIRQIMKNKMFDN